MLFVIPVDYPGQVGKALVVAESIRLHGGSLKGAPIRIYTLRSLRTLFDKEPDRIARLAVDVREVDVPREAGRHVLGVKPFSAA